MEKRLGWVVLFVLAESLQLAAAEKHNETAITSVSDFSRCKKIKIKQIHVDDEVCVNIAFIKSEIGIELSITWDGKVIFKTKISAENPPPLCFGVPLVKKLKACIKLTDVSFKPHHHGACLAIEIKALVFHKTFKLGCIYKEINDAKKRTPLEILEAVRALVNADKEKRTDDKKLDWIKLVPAQSGNDEEQKKKTEFKKFHNLLESSDIKNHVREDSEIKTCVGTKPRQFICCKNISLFQYKTKVCSKVIVTKKGKGLWVSLIVDEVDYFRVFTPVSRRFKFACGKLLFHNSKAVVCLHLNKVEETKKALDVCVSAVIHVKSFKYSLALGCLSSNITTAEKSKDAFVKFQPISYLAL